jgi:hypothetical protein
MTTGVSGRIRGDARSLRVPAVALAAASWIVLLWLHATPGNFDRFGQLRGTDFLQFYAAGWLVASDRISDLYDWDAFARTLPTLVPGIGDLLFLPIYPPQVALLFSPLGRFSYTEALLIWSAISVLLYVLSILAALRLLPALRPYALEAVAFSLGFPPFIQLLAHGQIATLAMLPLVAAFAAFKARRPFLVGVLLGVMTFKPQLGTFAIAGFALWPSLRLLTGILAGIGVQAAVVVMLAGGETLTDYVSVLLRLLAEPAAFEPKVWAMHSLRAAIVLVVGPGTFATVLWVAACVAVMWAAWRAWALHESRELRFGVLTLAAIMINPHLYIYDLVLLAVPVACIVAWMRQTSQPATAWRGRLLFALVWLPLFGPLTEYTHLQLTSPALIVLLLGLSRREEACCHCRVNEGRRA